MRFLQIINNQKFTLVSIFLLLYVILNLLDGDRGLISYYKKQTKINDLNSEKEVLTEKLQLVEKKNSLLTETVDKDYLEILYRKKFMLGKKSEKIYHE